MRWWQQIEMKNSLSFVWFCLVFWCGNKQTNKQTNERILCLFIERLSPKQPKDPNLHTMFQ
jgi:hypothetical protein